MEFGRHVEKAVVKYQQRGGGLADASRYLRDLEPPVASAYQIASATEYATARKLMGVEE